MGNKNITDVRRKNIDAIEKHFISLCLIIEKAQIQSNTSANNRARKSLIKIFKIFEQDINVAHCVLSALFLHENDTVKLDAAVHALSLKIKLEEAIDIITFIALNSKNKYTAFNAQACLDIWQQQGYIKVYKEQQIY